MKRTLNHSRPIGGVILDDLPGMSRAALLDAWVQIIGKPVPTEKSIREDVRCGRPNHVTLSPHGRDAQDNAGYAVVAVSAALPAAGRGCPYQELHPHE
jgi:hypothetical protein